MFTLKELQKQTDEKIVVLKTNSCRVDFNEIELNFELRHFGDWVRSIYHLATSNLIFIDNYFGFLASVKFKPNVKCVQLWHAAGAIKQFGLKDPSNAGRSPKAIERFKKVYSKFDYVVVGSEKMADIYRESFGIREENILRTGIPRTDFFFDNKSILETKNLMQKRFPVIRNKKVILYAPTYRENEFHISTLSLDIDLMYQELKEEYVLFLRLHPAVKLNLANQYPDFVFDMSGYPDVNQLLVITDLLISDYSSIPFEYSLLGRPMIFYVYDLEDYAKIRGFWEPYEELVPGPIVSDTKSLLHVIHAKEFDYNKISRFANEWNLYSTGNSSQLLIHHLHDSQMRAKN